MRNFSAHPAVWQSAIGERTCCYMRSDLKSDAQPDVLCGLGRFETAQSIDMIDARTALGTTYVYGYK